MPSLADLQALLEPEQGLGVVCTTRGAGGVQASVVNVGVLRHPRRAEDVAAFVARGGAVKLRHLRRDARVTVVARSGWLWVAVEGRAEIIGPDDAVAGFDPQEIPTLLRDVFRAAGGTHDDWAEYDRAMVEDRRAAVLVSPERIYSNASGP
jgi:PPOX class probable F420-dependent enzyme